ncbi:MAG: DUF2075 domain-containing protein [Polynucleobacter sp.]|nr:DUF2075 domain-containing protein [Polynucleobacter sp.]
MLVYVSTKSGFCDDVISNAIETKILEAFQGKLGHSTSPSEIDSWRNSMMYMNNVLSDKAIPADAGVSIEYKVPLTNKRIDFILTGKNENKKDTAIIVELKQWTDVEITEKDGLVSTFVGRGIREISHPSYQAWTYAALLEDFNETVRQDEIILKPCVYLHNCVSEEVINHTFYIEHTSKAPAFLKKDSKKLGDFIKQYVKYGDADNIMYRIDRGKIKPSKNLADKLQSLLQGNQEFLMIDDQKIVYETALSLTKKSTASNKHVLIVEGGPGTGKSVVAINLLVALTNMEKTAQYVTKNAAPRTVYESKLTGTFTRSRISNMFKGSGAYIEAESNVFDALIVDEAHRLNEKSGMFQNLGENQIKEIIDAAKCTIFFLDEDQRVTFKDIGDKNALRSWAGKAGATVQELTLQSQFRCNGSDGYLAWVDNALQIRETANDTLEGIDYDVRVFDSPTRLRDAIYAKNKANNKARLVAGYCWDWVSKNNNAAQVFDISFPEHDFAMKWNLASDGNLWILKPESVNEVGCIHTCQGLEIDYVGVIIGPDFVVRDGKIVTDASKRARSDSSVKGYKTLLKQNPESASAKADLIIKNTYRTLMTRGAKGCYLYCTDAETSAWFAQLIAPAEIQPETYIDKYRNLPLRLLSSKVVRPFENAVPVYDLKVAAGLFSNEQTVNEVTDTSVTNIEEQDWVELPGAFRPQPGLFVAQVIGESMNRRIPNGAWCLFKLNPGGTRQGKVVLVQHRDIQDQDTGARYTVKIYESDKEIRGDDSWQHVCIRLKPDTNAPGYKVMEFDGELEGELMVVAELVAVL